MCTYTYMHVYIYMYIIYVYSYMYIYMSMHYKTVARYTSLPHCKEKAARAWYCRMNLKQHRCL